MVEQVIVDDVGPVEWTEAVARTGRNVIVIRIRFIIPPAVKTLMGIPILGEIPDVIEWGAIFSLTFGVFLATGAKLNLKPA